LRRRCLQTIRPHCRKLLESIGWARVFYSKLLDQGPASVESILLKKAEEALVDFGLRHEISIKRLGFN